MARIGIIYDPKNGAAVPDGKVEEIFNALVQRAGENALIDPNSVTTVALGTENIVQRFRLGGMRKEFPFELVFVFEGEEIPMDETGVFPKHPDGFLKFHKNISDLILHVHNSILEARKAKEHRR